MKSLFAVSLIAAAFGAASVQADSALVSPHWKDAAPTVQAAESVDYAHAQTALGNAAQSKSARPLVAAGGAQADPNLIACRKVGKASCRNCGMVVPCCKTVTACCQ